MACLQELYDMLDQHRSSTFILGTLRDEERNFAFARHARSHVPTRTPAHVHAAHCTRATAARFHLSRSATAPNGNSRQDSNSSGQNYSLEPKWLRKAVLQKRFKTNKERQTNAFFIFFEAVFQKTPQTNKRRRSYYFEAVSFFFFCGGLFFF